VKRLATRLFNSVVGGPLWLLAPLLGFDRRYFRGRHFERHTSGYRMVLRAILFQKILGFNRACRFPVSHQSVVSNGKNLLFDPDDFNNLWHFGCYFQNFDATIQIGKGTYIAPNVGIITADHDLEDLDAHQPGKPVVIGEKCWIGMNAVILPGVVLGDRTVVGAGAVVTKSFPEGRCVLGGVPARKIRDL
jgi:hypothetical protein